MGERTGPTINRGGSKQDYETPPEFIAAVERKFGRLGIDLAASVSNHKASLWYGPYSICPDSLVVPWAERVQKLLCWLNPPFAMITPWALKCADEMKLGAEILLLVPASVGANWYWRWVERYATVYSVGRMKFVGCDDPYPRDLILAHYDPKVIAPPRMQRWRWETE